MVHRQLDEYVFHRYDHVALLNIETGFDLDTVKMLMNIFVSTIFHPITPLLGWLTLLMKDTDRSGTIGFAGTENTSQT